MRALDAFHHNQEFAYKKWLKENAIYSRQEPRRRKNERLAISIIGALSAYGFNAETTEIE
jgi:hypothetical protein